MNAHVPETLKNLAKACSFPLYVVGGTCRDFLADLTPSKRDLDICAPVDAEEFALFAQQNGFFVTAVYRNTGTVKLGDGENEYEFASFRSDEYVRGEHTPCKTFFTDDILLDAKRRDFRANAVYYDIVGGQFVDPLGGIADIEKREMNTVREAERVFGEDGLRLMRLCRQCATTGFHPSQACLKGAKANASLIRDIAPERVWAELDAILHADGKYGIVGGQYQGLRLLREVGVLPFILPELALGDGMAQRADYHDHDVLEHSFRCVLYAREDVRLAALLHDVGKPQVKLQTGKFAEHEVVGEQIARTILQRLRVGKKLSEEVCRLIRWHMYDLDGHTRENKVRKLIVHNLDIFDKLLALKQADYSACKDKTDVAFCVTRWSGIYEKMKAEGVPFTVKELAVRGDRLIAEGIPARKVGVVLNELLLLCVQSSLKNQEEALLATAIKLADLAE